MRFDEKAVIVTGGHGSSSEGCIEADGAGKTTSNVPPTAPRGSIPGVLRWHGASGPGSGSTSRASAARAISTLMLSAVILSVAALSIDWIAPAASSASATPPNASGSVGVVSK